MRKYLHFDLVVGYFFVIAIIIVCQSFTLKVTTGLNGKPINLKKLSCSDKSTSQTNNINPAIFSKNFISYNQYLKSVSTQSDSIDFEVKVIKPRKFLLSFYKKQASVIFIKIYDVLGNLVH